VQPAMPVQVSAAANLRRSSIVGVGLGLVSIVVLALLGHPFAGLFALIGIGLGALNNALLQRSVRSYALNEAITKKKFRHGVLGRLAAVTLIAVGCALLVRPDGLAVFVGLAVFHVIMLVGAAAPVFRSLRPTS
jgi:ATP synthase I chain